jgi:hypothetical protein
LDVVALLFFIPLHGMLADYALSAWDFNSSIMVENDAIICPFRAGLKRVIVKPRSGRDKLSMGAAHRIKANVFSEPYRGVI